MPKNIPECCVECLKWGQFGKECWTYWEGKKDCTMHTEKPYNQLLQ